MKTRLGFVSNSSSASFCIRVSDLNQGQLLLLKNYVQTAKDLGLDADEYDSIDSWTIDVGDKWVTGDTWMDNYDIAPFLRAIGIHEEQIRWEHS